MKAAEDKKHIIFDQEEIAELILCLEDYESCLAYFENVQNTPETNKKAIVIRKTLVTEFLKQIKLLDLEGKDESEAS